MKKNKLLILISMGYACFACNSLINEDHSARSINSINIDSVKIEINPSTLCKYQIFGGNDKYFAGFNSHVYSIDLFDLENNSLLKNILLERKGPNGIPFIKEIFVAKDKLVIHGGTFCYHVNMQGEIIKKYKLSNFKGVDYKEFNPIKKGFNIANFDRSFYCSDRNEMLIQYFPNNIDLFSKEYYEKPFICALDFEKESAKMLDIVYPDIFLDNTYGDLHVSYCDINGHLLVYNFINSAAIYTYDLKTQRQESYLVNSEFIPNMARSISKNEYKSKERIDHTFRSAKFFSVQYDKYNDVYYRIQCGKLASTEKMIMSGKRTYYLTVTDKKFKKISEFALPDNFYPPFILQKKGLVFQQRESSIDGLEYFTYYLLKYSTIRDRC